MTCIRKTTRFCLLCIEVFLLRYALCLYFIVKIDLYSRFINSILSCTTSKFIFTSVENWKHEFLILLLVVHAIVRSFAAMNLN